AFSTRCSPIGANVVHRSRTSGERSTVFSGFCAPALRGATCPSDTAIGIQSLCASHAGASSACGIPHSKPWRVLGRQPTRSMPSIPSSCGRTSMQPASKATDALMELHDINPDRLLGDKGYDSDDIHDLAERGIEPVIPPRSSRKTPIECDREAYKRRNLIERCVIVSISSAASQPVTRKPPELSFRGSKTID